MHPKAFIWVRIHLSFGILVVALNLRAYAIYLSLSRFASCRGIFAWVFIA